jgi:hypothetical protein
LLQEDDPPQYTPLSPPILAGLSLWLL